MKLQNSFLLLVTDQPEYGIGTVSLSAPPVGPNLKATSSPFNIFGLKNNMLANLVGRNATNLLKAPVMTMLLIKNTQIKPEVIMKVVTDTVKIAIDEYLANKQK